MNEMKKILLIGTGGTIASDVTDSGLAPELTTEQLLSHIPGISDICGVDCLQLLNLDSTNMTPAHWLEIAARSNRWKLGAALSKAREKPSARCNSFSDKSAPAASR